MPSEGCIKEESIMSAPESLKDVYVDELKIFGQPMTKWRGS